MKGESGKAYDAFLVYRDMGGTRSSAATAEAVGKAGSLIRRWKLQWRWDVRARAWDDYLLLRRDEARIDAEAIMVSAPVQLIAEMNQRHLAAAQTMQQKALLRLATVDPADLGPQAAWQYLQEAIRLERAVMLQLPDEPKGDEADQDAVVKLLSNPTTRALAGQLAEAAGHSLQEERPA